jgi:predicted transcriptional regulator
MRLRLRLYHKELLMRRTREQIIVGLLRACSKKSLTVGKVMAAQNLSHKILQSYLNSLVPQRLLEHRQDGRKKLIHTTTRGITVLKCYRNSIALLNGQPSTCPLVGELSDVPECRIALGPHKITEQHHRRLSQNIVTEY